MGGREGGEEGVCVKETERKGGGEAEGGRGGKGREREGGAGQGEGERELGCVKGSSFWEACPLPGPWGAVLRGGGQSLGDGLRCGLFTMWTPAWVLSLLFLYSQARG